jgi:ankyrin repeat protein
LKILEDLIKHKASVNSEKGQHGTALYASAARGDKAAVEKLLRAGAKLDGEDHGDLGSPLHVAAFNGHNDVVELFLEEKGLAVDQPTRPFGTALQAASAAGRSNTVKLLLDKQADPNIVGGCLRTAA